MEECGLALWNNIRPIKRAGREWRIPYPEGLSVAATSTFDSLPSRPVKILTTTLALPR
jgi:hypothetical protein